MKANMPYAEADLKALYQDPSDLKSLTILAIILLFNQSIDLLSRTMNSKEVLEC